jgi:hypothetical protein
MLYRVATACEAYDRTAFITDFDDWTSKVIEVQLGADRDKLLYETVHFDIGCWRHFVREGVFPDVPKV